MAESILSVMQINGGAHTEAHRYKHVWIDMQMRFLIKVIEDRADTKSTCA